MNFLNFNCYANFREIFDDTPNGFVDHPMAAAPLPGLGVGTSRITDCGMDTSAGSFDFYTVLNDPQPGEMLDFYARQDDVPVLVETMEVDESGRAVFPLPNFAGIGIDESAEYDLFAVPAGEAPDEPNCRVTFNIEE